MKKSDVTVRVCFIILVFVIIFSWSYGIKTKNREEKELIKSVDVQFSGKIIQKTKVTRMAREICIVCIQIDYANVDSILLYDKNLYQYLKIENNIATMVISVGDYNIDSVSVNINNNRIKKYFKKGILEAEYPLFFDSAYATEQDLQICEQ